MLEGVGREIASIFPGITRLGGQIVAALYLADEPRSMGALSRELGRSKSNIFANLRALEAAGIVARQRAEGARFDTYALRGKYPDVIVGAYLARLRGVVDDKRELSRRTIAILEGARGPEAGSLRQRLGKLSRKYDRFAALLEELLPSIDGPIDLEAMLDMLPAPVLRVVARVARRALGIRKAR
jgi:DNA-binding transcriptional regulator GbsR (MarR family)